MEMSSSDYFLMQIWKAVDVGLLQQVKWSSLTKLGSLEWEAIVLVEESLYSH